MKDKEISEAEFFVGERDRSWRDFVDLTDLASLHHLARYEWACSIASELEPRRVLDIACGSGYGTALLARALPHAQVVGVDADPRAVALSVSHEPFDNLSFFVGDLVTWSAEVDGGRVDLPAFDLITCFDTIEHVRHRELAWLRLEAGLAVAGTLLLSTPVWPGDSVLQPEWHAHELEYGRADLLSVARKHFRVVLEPIDSDFPGRAFWDEVNEGATRYLNLANPLVLRH